MRRLAFRRAAVLAPGLLFLAAAVAPAGGARADARETLRFGVTFHVAREGDRPVIDPPRLERWVARANALFAASGVEIGAERVHALAGPAQLTTIAERRRLARHLVPRMVNVFVVSTIEDPNPSAATRRAAAQQGRAPTGRLAGAHIRVRGHRPGTYIILIASGDGTSLAHELGHFFGAPHHADPANVMSYGHERSRFDRHQLDVFRMFARRYLRRGDLRPAG